ncbi:hypothetical protein ACA910_000863 [Epithemia clementina (nom. ined.)]
MFPDHAHLLALLTLSTLQQQGPIKWVPKHQTAFDTIKALIASDVLLCYPDHNKPFHVHTDASDLQLGTVIVIDNHPIAFYSLKLNAAQCNYTTMEKELLSIVETLKEFCTMLYGCSVLHVHTDHKNLTFQTLNSQCTLCWQLFLEEFHPLFHYIAGPENVLANALSQLPCLGRQNAVPVCSPAVQMLQAKLKQLGHCYTPLATSPSANTDTEDTLTNKVQSHTYSMAMDPNLLDCFVHLPPFGNIPLPLSYK